MLNIFNRNFKRVLIFALLCIPCGELNAFTDIGLIISTWKMEKIVNQGISQFSQATRDGLNSASDLYLQNLIRTRLEMEELSKTISGEGKKLIGEAQAAVHEETGHIAKEANVFLGGVASLTDREINYFTERLQGTGEHLSNVMKNDVLSIVETVANRETPFILYLGCIFMAIIASIVSVLFEFNRKVDFGFNALSLGLLKNVVFCLVLIWVVQSNYTWSSLKIVNPVYIDQHVQYYQSLAGLTTEKIKGLGPSNVVESYLRNAVRAKMLLISCFCLSDQSVKGIGVVKVRLEELDSLITKLTRRLTEIIIADDTIAEIDNIIRRWDLE
ncbi:MAG: hypothetical protein WA705_20420 [Candidatus Ozemobacteraceae bacterium]